MTRIPLGEGKLTVWNPDGTVYSHYEGELFMDLPGAPIVTRMTPDILTDTVEETGETHG